jgi:gliding-associated putative ABC transporter substrate-binding component GldG
MKAYILLVVGLLLMLSSPWLRQRWDLSEDQRFTLAPSSVSVIQSLDAPIRIKVYLGGKNLPGGFKRMARALDELLEDLKQSSSQGIEIEHIDLYAEYPKEAMRQKMVFLLDSLGLPPTNVVNSEDGKQVQQMIFPGIVIEKGERAQGLLLLKGNQLASPQEVLNQSIEGMEYEIVQAIQSLTDGPRKKIGFFLDHSHVPAVRQLDLIANLRKSYDLYPVDLSASMTLDGLDAIFVGDVGHPSGLARAFAVERQFLGRQAEAEEDLAGRGRAVWRIGEDEFDLV